jgi:hypothetical protein
VPTVQLDDDEWQKVMACISQAPWNIANPLLMKIGAQLRQQMPENPVKQGEIRTDKLNG